MAAAKEEKDRIDSDPDATLEEKGQAHRKEGGQYPPENSLKTIPPLGKIHLIYINKIIEIYLLNIHLFISSNKFKIKLYIIIWSNQL